MRRRTRSTCIERPAWYRDPRYDLSDRDRDRSMVSRGVAGARHEEVEVEIEVGSTAWCVNS